MITTLQNVIVTCPAKTQLGVRRVRCTKYGLEESQAGDNAFFCHFAVVDDTSW